MSFIYTEKITDIVKNKDPIMKSIIKNKNTYKKESVSALIEDKTLIPGVSGCEIDVDKSYENMKKINKYNEKLLKYKDLIPEISINNIFDKYISSGNKEKRNVSIIVYIKDELSKTNLTKNIKLNIFLDGSLLNEKKEELKNVRVYNGGINYNYDDNSIKSMNKIIEENYNKSRYCINKNMDDSSLQICDKNKMHTIYPKLIVNNTNTYNIKTQIENGSIIYFDEKSITKINEMANYIIKKGYDIVYLDELLDERGCKI